jgi:hypothetical protein
VILRIAPVVDQLPAIASAIASPMAGMANMTVISTDGATDLTKKTTGLMAELPGAGARRCMDPSRLVLSAPPWGIGVARRLWIQPAHPWGSQPGQGCSQVLQD